MYVNFFLFFKKINDFPYFKNYVQRVFFQFSRFKKFVQGFFNDFFFSKNMYKEFFFKKFFNDFFKNMNKGRSNFHWGSIRK